MTSNPAFEVSIPSDKKPQITPEEDRLKDPVQGSSQMTRLEKIFLLLLLLLAAALVGVIVVLTIQVKKDDKEVNAIIHVTKGDNDTKTTIEVKKCGEDSKTIEGRTKGDKEEVCMSTECVMTAAAINAKLDHSVEPCDDFYQFACGNWVKERVIPADKSKSTVIGDLDDKRDIVLKNLLEADISPGESEYTAKAKTFYKSCMNYDLINKRGTGPLMTYLSWQFGQWPLITKGWDSSSFNFMNTFVKLMEHDWTPLMLFDVDVDLKNTSKRILMIDQAGLLMPGREYYLEPRNDSMLMAYERLIYKAGEYFGFANPSTAKQEVKDMVDFEIKLAQIHVPSEERRDANKMYNPMTLQEVHNNYWQILDWKRFVYTIMELPGIGINDITDTEVIVNYSPLYFQKLGALLVDTPKRTLANYLLWYAIMRLAETQGDAIRDLDKDYDKLVYGIDQDPPRYKTCVSDLAYYMELALSKLFIKENFDAESKTVALDMIKDLHESFNDLLSKNDWMDDATKKLAEEKNRYIEPHIGYPEQILNETFLVKLYENYTFHEDMYLENNLNILKNDFKHGMADLRKPMDKKKNLFDPSQVNAYYDPTKNQITFPAGILQPPFFKKTFPKSLNYGGIGTVIGHEITHGFDDQGRQFDKNGNVVQWWSQDAIDRFKVKSKCIIEQYGNYTVEQVKMKVNGINTQGENIADNGGIKQAYNAYRKWVTRQGKEEDPLPGLPYTHDQLFFINFAQIWCNKMKDNEAISFIRTGVHSPWRFRAIGSVQNSEDFSRVFDCPAMSRMNPQKKCSVW